MGCILLYFTVYNATLENKSIHTQLVTYPQLFEPHREKTGFLPMRKQRRRSASR